MSIKISGNAAFGGAQISLESCFSLLINFNIYEQENFHAQLSWAWKKFYNLGARGPFLERKIHQCDLDVIRAVYDCVDLYCYSIKFVEYVSLLFSLLYTTLGGWSGGAKVLGKLPVPGRPTNSDYSRARAYCACSRWGWGLFGHFFSHLFSFSLSLGDGPI